MQKAANIGAQLLFRWPSRACLQSADFAVVHSFRDNSNQFPVKAQLVAKMIVDRRHVRARLLANVPDADVVKATLSKKARRSFQHAGASFVVLNCAILCHQRSETPVRNSSMKQLFYFVKWIFCRKCRKTRAVSPPQNEVA